MQAIRVLVCSAQSEKKTSLRAMFENERRFELAGICSGHNESVAAAVTLLPQVILMDTELSGHSGIEATRHIKAHRPQVHILMYTFSEDDDKLFASLGAGASGYLLKTSSLQQLANAIVEVVEGGSPMSPCMARKVIDYFHQKYHPNYSLCERELGILRLLVQGCPIKFIAGEVHLSIDGVKKNLANIYHKMKVSCGKEAIAKAIREQVVY